MNSYSLAYAYMYNICKNNIVNIIIYYYIHVIRSVSVRGVSVRGLTLELNPSKIRASQVFSGCLGANTKK